MAHAEESIRWLPLGDGAIFSGYEGGDDVQSGYFSALVPLASSLRQQTLGHTGGLVFMEPYGHWYGEGFAQAGVGFGYRHLIAPQQSASAWMRDGVYLGLNAFIDMAETPHDMRFYQVALGAEVGTRWFELRGRYTMPVGDDFTHSSLVAGSSTEKKRISGQSLTVETLRMAYLETKIEALSGWNVEATALLPLPKEIGEVRLVTGYANFFSEDNNATELDTWSAGVEYRPLPPLVTSATWFADENVTGASWMFGVGLELPLEVFTGDGKGQGFWGRLKNAFKPRQLNMLDRMAGSARSHALPVQLAVTPTVEWVRATRIARADVSIPQELTFAFESDGFLFFLFEPGFSATNWPVALELYDSFIAHTADVAPLSIGAFYRYQPQTATRLLEQIPFSDHSLKAALNHEGPGFNQRVTSNSRYTAWGVNSADFSSPFGSAPLAFRYLEFGVFASLVWQSEVALFRETLGYASRSVNAYDDVQGGASSLVISLGRTESGSDPIYNGIFNLDVSLSGSSFNVPPGSFTIDGTLNPNVPPLDPPPPATP
jgi:hypothetical protein